MKLQFFIAMCIAIAMTSCETSHITSRSTPSNLIGIISVDCRSDEQTHQLVVRYLKMARVMEWKTSQQGGFETVEARYETLTSGKASEIEQVLMQQAGVSMVTVRWETGILSLVPQRTPMVSTSVWPGQ